MGHHVRRVVWLVVQARAIRYPANRLGRRTGEGRSPLNTSNRGNNSNNNRRRGRSNSNSNRQGAGNGQQLNRVDSRARGNAPQMLEKYRKLAHDAHLNGDRVNAEYYLQFADHYFRVMADQRTRQDEQRARREDGTRWEGGEEGEDSGEFNVENNFPSYDSAAFNRDDRPAERWGRDSRPQREERPAREDRPAREERQPREDRAAREDRPARDDAPARDNRPRSQDRSDQGAEAEPLGDSSEAASPQGYEPAENPFVREPRAPRGLRPRRDDRRPSRDDSASDSEPAAARFDVSVLPPAIGGAREDSVAAREESVAEAAAPAAPRRGRPRKAAAEAADPAD